MIGLGLIGQLLVQLLDAAGVRVVGVDISAERCRLAEAQGAVRAAGARARPTSTRSSRRWPS